MVNEYYCNPDKVNNLTAERLLTLSAKISIYISHAIVYWCPRYRMKFILHKIGFKGKPECLFTLRPSTFKAFSVHQFAIVNKPLSSIHLRYLTGFTLSFRSTSAKSCGLMVTGPVMNSGTL